MTGNITIAVAFLAGIVSFASPCCLPMVPAYVSYIVGGNPADLRVERRTTLHQALAFVLGFTVVFVALWASIGLVGYLLRDNVNILRQVGGAILILMGLHVAGLITLPMLGRQAGPGMDRLLRRNADGTVDHQRPRVGRSVLFGVVFAAGWTPCVGPVLSGIIGLASLRSSVGEGALLLIAYAVGLGVPFIFVALGASALGRRLKWFAQHAGAVSIVTGSLLVIVGFLMMSNLFVRLSQFAPSFLI